jgi:large subunit ribosomal protein L30
MSKLKIKLVKSAIHRPGRQKRTLKALGLGKLNTSVEVEATDQIKGMVKSVKHLLEIEEGK